MCGLSVSTSPRDSRRSPTLISHPFASRFPVRFVSIGLTQDYSGAPLICDESVKVVGGDGTAVRRTIRGLLTWSTDINHAPHLFTNLTTYQGWIERTIGQLGQRPAASVQRRRPQGPEGPPPPAAITVQSDSPSVVLYG